MTPSAIRSAVIAVLADIALLPDGGLPQGNAVLSDDLEGTPSKDSDGGTVHLAPLANTWSRDARRQMARGTTLATLEKQTQENRPRPGPLFRMELHFLPRNPPRSAGEGVQLRHPPAPDDVDVAKPVTGLLEFRFMEFRKEDRAVAESLWKFLLTKARLLRGQPK